MPRGQLRTRTVVAFNQNRKRERGDHLLSRGFPRSIRRPAGVADRDDALFAARSPVALGSPSGRRWLASCQLAEARRSRASPGAGLKAGQTVAPAPGWQCRGPALRRWPGRPRREAPRVAGVRKPRARATAGSRTMRRSDHCAFASAQVTSLNHCSKIWQPQCLLWWRRGVRPCGCARRGYRSCGRPQRWRDRAGDERRQGHR
jgi:hypothetical protein